MDSCTRIQGGQMKTKISVKKENISEGLLSSMKSVLQSRKELCSITDCLKCGNKEDFIEITFLGLSRESGIRNLQGVTALYVDVPELIQSSHLCNLNENEVILLKDGKEVAKSSATQNFFSGSLCMMTSAPFALFKSDYLFVLLSKYSAGVRYAIDQDCLRMNKKADHHEDDDTNHSVSSIEDDFVTAFEHLDEEDPINTNDNQGFQWRSSTNHRDAASQTQPPHCPDISGTKIIFSSVRRKSSIKSTVLMSFLGHQDISSLAKNASNTSYDAWKHENGQDKSTFSPSPAETSESECSSPSPIIFLDEEGYQKSLRAKLSLPKIPVGKDGVEDSDSELSEFFDSFDRFDELDPSLEDNCPVTKKPILASPPKKRKNAKISVSTVCMNPQKFKFDRPTLSASIKKPTPRKAESPFSSIVDVPESPRLAKTCAEDNGSLFSPIRSSAFSPPGLAIGSEGSFQPRSQNEATSCKADSYVAFSNYANRVCADMFDSILKTKPSSEHVKNVSEKVTKLRRKSNKEFDRKMKTKHKSIKGGIQKFAADLVEKSFGNAFKDLQRGVSSCTSALCHLATRLTSYVFQMAFYEIGRRQAFSIKKRAINGLANLMVSEVMTSALQELRYIKKQMVTNAVTRFAADLAEELVFEGIMEVCQFSHPPTPNVSSDAQCFDYEDVTVSSYAKDLSESVIQEAFIQLSQVNVTFTTEAAISVSMDNLKYVGSEGINQSTQSSPSFPNPSLHNLASPAPQESKRDFTVHYALLFTSGLMSSVPVPVAAKVLSQHSVSSDHTDVSTNNYCINNADNYNFSKELNEPPSDFSSSINCSVANGRREQRYVDFIKEEADGAKPFSVTMVDMIVNEAYDVIKSTRTVEDYAEAMTKRIIEIPSQHLSLQVGSSQHQLADELAKSACRHPSGKNTRSISSRWDSSKSNRDISVNLVGYHTNFCAQVEHASLNPYFTAKPSSRDRKSGSANKHPSITFLGNSNNGTNKDSLVGLPPRTSAENSEATDTPLFGLQSCLPHINSLSSVMCSCGGDFFTVDRHSNKGSNLTLLPGTPPSTPLTSYDISPERSMKKLSKKLKGQLAKEFYPATPPSTPHLSAYEHNTMKKDDFMRKLMRSLSEEIESSSSDESSEEFEVSEDTSRYAEYLSSNIISIATDMAAYSLVDESVQGPPMRNRSQLSILSDKWGYPAYMRNITEELLETLCSYANCVAGEVISDAKEVLGSRKNSACDLEYSISGKSDKDCRPKERGYNYTSFKSSDAATLPLPHHYGGAGLTSKYPSCESVTEEYADHLIRVLKMEGGSSELILDQYASRLVYGAIKAGLQQASKTVKVKCNRKIMPRMKPEASSNKDIFRLLSRTHHVGKDNRRPSNVLLPSFTEDTAHKTEFNRLIHFAESLANTITVDVKKRLKLSAASLPKSLTDSCLYTKSKNDYVSGELVKTSFSKTPLLFSQKQKLYHSTGSLNENGYSESFIQTIEQYACKVVDSTLEFSLERARLQAMENRRKADKDSNAAKLVHSYGTACRLCSAKEQQGNPLSSCHFLLGHDISRKIKQCAKSKQNTGQKSRLFHLNIPKIQIDLDKRAMFADKIVSAAIEKAERELSSTSLAGDSGIGNDGVSFAESLTTEILMSAMKNIGHVVNISSIGKDGFQSVDSVTSQQTSVSVGDDSMGSWSNLSFEDEHQDESSSFLHLSDSDGAEEKDEDLKLTTEVGEQQRKILLIRNLDLGPSTVESQLRTILQWIAASECDVSELCFPENAVKDLILLFRRIREKGWKIGDLLQAVLQYCESSETSSNLPNPIFGWLLEKV